MNERGLILTIWSVSEVHLTGIFQQLRDEWFRFAIGMRLMDADWLLRERIDRM